MLDYLGLKEDECATKTTFIDFLAALRFLETAGEMPAGDRHHDTTAVRNLVKEGVRKGGTQITGISRWGRRAPPSMLALIFRFEKVMTDEGTTPFARIYAWCWLVRHWSATRFDDILGFRPDSIRVLARGVAGQLERTKTSGPAKTMQFLPVFVSDQAYFKEKNRMHTGLAVMGAHFRGQRDYLLPLPHVSVNGELGRRVLYTDAAGFSRHLLGALTRSDDDSQALLIEQAGQGLTAGMRRWTCRNGSATSWVGGQRRARPTSARAQPSSSSRLFRSGWPGSAISR